MKYIHCSVVLVTFLLESDISARTNITGLKHLIPMFVPEHVSRQMYGNHTQMFMTIRPVTYRLILLTLCACWCRLLHHWVGRRCSYDVCYYYYHQILAILC